MWGLRFSKCVLACGFLLQKRYVLTLIAKNFDNRKPINIKFKRNNLLAKMIIAARKKSKKTKYFWFWDKRNSTVFVSNSSPTGTSVVQLMFPWDMTDLKCRISKVTTDKCIMLLNWLKLQIKRMVFGLECKFPCYSPDNLLWTIKYKRNHGNNRYSVQ